MESPNCVNLFIKKAFFNNLGSLSNQFMDSKEQKWGIKIPILVNYHRNPPISWMPFSGIDFADIN
jgi:hypothetical protein